MTGSFLPSLFTVCSLPISLGHISHRLLQLRLPSERALKDTAPWEESGQLIGSRLKCLCSAPWMPICRRHRLSLYSLLVPRHCAQESLSVCTGSGDWGPSPSRSLWKLVLLSQAWSRHVMHPCHMVRFQSSTPNLNQSLMYIWDFFESLISHS